MKKIRVLIIDDDRQEIKRFSHIISSSRDIEVIGTATTGYEGVLEAATSMPDIVLIDDDMENPKCGILASKALLKKFPDMKIIILTDNEEGYVVHSAFKAGIVDYILKKSQPAEIIKAIKDVHKLDHPRQQNITEKFYQRTLHPEGVRDSLMLTLTVVSQLTPRELEITKLIVEGKSCKEIAEIRNTDVRTIEEYINRILTKFNKKNINELVKVLRTLSITELLNHIV